MNTKLAQRVLADAQSLLQQLEADLKVLQPAVGNWNYSEDKRMYELQREELKRFLKVYATTQDETMLKLYAEAEKFLTEHDFWYPQDFQRTEQEYAELAKVYEQILSNPFKPTTRKKIGEYQLLTMEERKGLRVWTRNRNKDRGLLNSLTNRIHAAMRRTRIDMATKPGGINRVTLSGALLNVVEANYGTRFVKEIKIIKIVRSCEQVREGMSPYTFTDPTANFTLRVKLKGDNRIHTFVYHDQSMTGGGWMVKQPYEEGQVYNY